MKKISISTIMVFLTVIIAAAVCISCGATSPKSLRSDGTYKLGDRGPAGGFIFYINPNAAKDGWRYLEAAPEDQQKSSWGCPGQSIAGAKGTRVGTGKSNTTAILRDCGVTDLNFKLPTKGMLKNFISVDKGSAAKLASAYRGGGMSDWFLPSRDELQAMYTNLHKAKIGGFSSSNYWSSSDDTVKTAWAVFFALSGLNSQLDKKDDWRVRAIRSF